MLMWIVLTPIVAVIILRIFLRYNVKMCTSKERMVGKVVIVTGANSGLGLYTALDLASRGARVILACRNDDRGITARNNIISKTGNSDVVYKKLDLSSIDSIRRFCDDINSTERRLDVLVNNAGVYGLGDRYTTDGIIEGMQVNHFGPFLLTELLLPLLKKSRPSRIVNLTSIFHYIGSLKVDYINRKGYYNNILTYSNGKFCNVLYTVELSKRLEGSGVVVNAVHPGIIHTNIAQNTSSLINIVFMCACWVCYRTPEEGAQTTIHLCVAPECGHVSGKYYVDCEQWKYSWKCNNKTLALNLRDISEKLTGLKVNGTNKSPL